MRRLKAMFVPFPTSDLDRIWPEDIMADVSKNYDLRIYDRSQPIGSQF